MKYLIPLLLLVSNIATAQEPERKPISEIFSNYFSTANIINKNIFELHHGPELFSFNQEFNSSFERNYATQIEYGFFRFDTDLSKDGLLYFSSEKVYFGNSSSRFKLEGLREESIKSDIYRYGAAYMNGFGYGEKGGSQLLFSHESGFLWSHTDIENLPIEEDDRKLLHDFYKQHNFGMYFASGIRYSFANSIVNLSLRYHKNIIWADFQGWNWAGSWLTENVLQRWIDFMHPSILEQFKYLYPIIYHTYKTAVSYAIYELRSKDSYWPLPGSNVFEQESVRFGISLVF